MELPTPSSMPRLRISGLVQKMSSPTSSTFVPNSEVRIFQPCQSFSARPSSISTIGYCPTHDSHSSTISSDVFVDLSDLKWTYLPFSHISLVAGLRHSESSSPC